MRRPRIGRHRPILPLLVALPLLTGCASTSAGADPACPRPEVDPDRLFGLPTSFDPPTLEGRWRLTVVTATGLETPRVDEAPLVLVPSPDSLYVHPFCLGAETCYVEYPLRGWIERPLDVGMSTSVDPTSTDPEAPGVVLEWIAERREATLVFGNPSVRGSLSLDAGGYFDLLVAEPGRLGGFWNDGGLGVYVTPEGRELGPRGGWFCAERTG